MKIAVVDDIQRDRTRLEESLKQYDSIHQLGLIIIQYPSGEALLQEYKAFDYAVIFLDIYMDGITGIDTAEKIRAEDEDVILVFTTTSDMHRAEAFGSFATAYLKKPFSDDEVFRVLDHILRIRTDKEKRFSLSYDRRNYNLSYSDIVSMETDGNYLVVRDIRGMSYRTRMTFSKAEEEVDSRFLTLLKGIMVNMDHVAQIKDNLCTMKDGSTFPVHVKRSKDLKQKWLNYKFTAIRDETDCIGRKNR